MKTKENTTLNSYYVPESGTIDSGIQVIELNDKGLKLRRLNSYYEGEEFFLTWDAWTKSKWEPYNG